MSVFQNINPQNLEDFWKTREDLSPAVVKLLEAGTGFFDEKTDIYAGMLQKWQEKINLVASGTLNDILSRHFLDSLQLASYLPDPDQVIYDFGSGAGFPGMVLAQLGYRNVHLIESDQRKCVFLKEVARQTKTEVNIRTVRIETLEENSCDIVVSRACASLDQLLTWSHKALKKGGKCLFLKGEKFEEELTAAQKKWHILLQTYPSCTRSGSVVVEIEEFSPLK